MLTAKLQQLEAVVPYMVVLLLSNLFEGDVCLANLALVMAEVAAEKQLAVADGSDSYDAEPTPSWHSVNYHRPFLQRPEHPLVYLLNRRTPHWTYLPLESCRVVFHRSTTSAAYPVQSCVAPTSKPPASFFLPPVSAYPPPL